MAVWSQILTSDLVGAIRLDAEFWQPAYLEKEKTIRINEHAALGNLVGTFKKGIFYILAREYTNHGVPFYRSSNVGAILPKEEGLTYITERKHQDEYKTALVNGDLMIVKTGKSGASVVLQERCNVSQDVIAVKVRRERVNPYYLAVYLDTRFGSSEMNRWFQGQVQPHLSLEDARRIWVPLIAELEQQQIEKLVLGSAKAKNDSEQAWSTAQQFLESELGLDKLRLQKPMGYTASFSDLEMSRRFDAQHYQFQFSQLLAHLAKFTTYKIRQIRSCNRRGIQPLYVADGAFDVINSQHLGPKHIDYAGLQKTSHQTFVASPEAHIRQNDLLIYTTGAYIGRTNVYLSNAPALASNHVNILRITPEIDAAYLAIVFQSVVGQFQTQKHSRGSAQAELYSNDIDKFIVPILPFEIQTTIGNLVRESLEKQRESARLLAQAKTRVEQLIEAAVQS